MFPLVQELLEDVYERSEGVISFAAIFTVWTAGKGMLALMRGLNAVGSISENRNYVHVRIVACLYTILMLVMVMVSLFVMVFGNRLVEMLLYHMPHLRLLAALLMHFRFLAVWFLLTLLFMAVYAYVPNGKRVFREQLPGASFTAVAWSVFSYGFSLYVDRADYSIYGSLAMIILLMLWMYFCMYILMVGAYINRYFQPMNKEIFTKKKK